MQILDPFLSHEDVGLGLLDVGHQILLRASQQGIQGQHQQQSQGDTPYA